MWTASVLSRSQPVGSNLLTLQLLFNMRSKRSYSGLQPWCDWQGPADDRFYETLYFTIRLSTWAGIRQRNFWMSPMCDGFGAYISLYNSPTQARACLLRREGAEDHQIMVYSTQEGAEDLVAHLGPGPICEAVLIELFMPLPSVLDLVRSKGMDRHPCRNCWRLWQSQGLQLTQHHFRVRTVLHMGNTLL